MHVPDFSTQGPLTILWNFLLVPDKEWIRWRPGWPELAFVAALLALGWGLRRASSASVSAARKALTRARRIGLPVERTCRPSKCLEAAAKPR